MRNVLILDDDTERYAVLEKYARNLVYDPKITTVASAEGAKVVLQADVTWELLLLDHDLGFERGNSGSHVARFIRQNGVKFKRCIIHSVNHVGARWMWQELKDLGDVTHVPFYVMVGKTFEEWFGVRAEWIRNF